MADSREIRYMRPHTDAGGEGSRGGKIVGHTSGGKPIYDSHGHPDHADFTAKDHEEASKVHTRKQVLLSGEARQAKTDESRQKAMKMHEHHGKQSTLHAESSKKFGVKGETTAQFAANAKATHEFMKSKDTRGL